MVSFATLGFNPAARHIAAVVRQYLPKFERYADIYGLTRQEQACLNDLRAAHGRLENDYRSPVGDLDLEWCIGVAHFAMQLPEPVPAIYFSQGMDAWPVNSSNPRGEGMSCHQQSRFRDIWVNPDSVDAVPSDRQMTASW